VAAPSGNKFWLERASHGRGKLFTSPEILKESCLEYFDWSADNPLYERKVFAFQGSITCEDVPVMRAMTVKGLCLFLGCDYSTWREYALSKDFSEVCGWAEEVIRQQKFEGAAANLLNASIIARDLGLADKRESSVTVVSGDLNDALGNLADE